MVVRWKWPFQYRFVSSLSPATSSPAPCCSLSGKTGTTWPAPTFASSRCRQSASATSCPAPAWRSGRPARSWSSVRCGWHSASPCWPCASSWCRRRSKTSSSGADASWDCWKTKTTMTHKLRHVTTSITFVISQAYKQECLSIEDRPPTNTLVKLTFYAPVTLTLIYKLDLNILKM